MTVEKAEQNQLPGGRLLRFWLPIGMLVFAAVTIPVLLYFPSDFEDVWRQLLVQLIAILTGVGLLLWFLLFSGAAIRYRIMAVILVGLLFGAAALFIEKIEFTGNITPIVHFRFEPEPAAILEAHRANAPPPSEMGSPALRDAVRNHPFPAYRGEARDGVVAGPPLQTDWRAQPPVCLWRQPIGGGYSSFAIAGELAVTMEQRRDKEAVVAYDVLTGQERWAYEYAAYFSETMGGDGPRATPTIAGERVYALGATGVLSCLEIDSGEEVWQTNILSANDDPNLTWGMSGSPLVYDGLVVVNPGTQSSSAEGHALVAFDATTGTPAWSSGSHRAGYSSPMLATLDGKRQILLFDGEGLGGYDAEGGSELWRHPWITQEGINVAQPIVLGEDRVFISSGYGVGCAMLQVKQAEGQWNAKEIWKNKAMRCRFTSPVLRDGYLYGLDEGILVCVDAETGKRQWKKGRYLHGQILLQDDLIVVLGEQGELALVTATPKEHDEIGQVQAIEGKTWNYPAMSAGLVLVRNHREMACYDLRQSRE